MDILAGFGCFMSDLFHLFGEFMPFLLKLFPFFANLVTGEFHLHPQFVA